MSGSTLPQGDIPTIDAQSLLQLRQPGSCPVTVGLAIAMYEQELERHRETVARLRDSVIREGELLRKKDELILQKDILIKESDHRFMNGLQLIASVLSMQSRSTSNLEAAEQLGVAAKRVSTLARVHRHLHSMDVSERVEFKSYLKRLCHELSVMVSCESTPRIICVKGDELTLPRITATPLAFIASELITNSMKYASGEIVVRLQKSPSGDAVLSVSDNGPGLPELFDPVASTGLGMQIISTLIRQIHGELKISKGDHGKGACFSVLFNASCNQ